MKVSTLRGSPGARVTVQIDWDTIDPTIETGLEEDARHAWQEAILRGVRFALESANALPCGVRVTRLEADLMHTSAAIVAAATVVAVWGAIGFTAPAEACARVEAAVTRSLDGPLDAPPDF